MRQLVIGDIHGGHKALLQVLQRCGYDPYEDQIIFLGDFVDGWSESYEVIETLIELQKVSKHGNIHLMGNHDKWFEQWYTTGYHSWTHGSANTALSYAKHANVDVTVTPRKTWSGKGNPMIVNDIDLSTEVVPEHHRQFFNSLSLFYFDQDAKRLFVHAGINKFLPLRHQTTDDVFYWSRTLFFDMLDRWKGEDERKIEFVDPIDECYIGHTTTLHGETLEPIIHAGVIAMDTGGGFRGKLTIMDVETKEFWQSDNLQTLYPDEKGR